MWLDDAHDVDIVPQNRMDPTYVEHSFTACALNPAWVSAKDHCQWPGVSLPSHQTSLCRSGIADLSSRYF